MRRHPIPPIAKCTSTTYDRNGNLVSIVPTAASQRTLAYDTANRMVSFQDTATNARYRYDALGRRIEKTVGGVTTQFFSDGIREIEEQDQSGNTIATYVFGNGVDEPLTMERAGTDHFYHADELGSVVALSGGSGATTETYAYDDFGRPAFFDAGGASMPASTAGNAFLFTGRRYDAETGLYEQRTRYFDPRAGRFASGDTIGGWGDHGNLGNSYAYVANDPFTLVDPEGTKPSAYQDFANWARDAFRGEWQRAQQNPLWREMQRHYHKLNGQNWKPAPSNRLYGTKPPSKKYKINYERTPQGMSERLKLMKQPWLEESYLRARERLRLASERFHTKLTRTVPKIPSVKVPCPPKTVKPVRIGAGPLNTRPKIPKLRIPKAPKVPGLNVIIGAGAFIYFMSQGATPAHAISETVEHTQVDYQHYGELVGEHGWIKGTNEYIIEMGESLQPGIDALAPRPGTELPYANMNTKWK
jgi:RHS repeat-associated protein